MDFVGILSSGILSILSFALVAACAVKVFQMAGTLNEIKEILSSIKTNAIPPAAVPIATQHPLNNTQSGEEMLRALSLELDQPVSPSADLGRNR